MERDRLAETKATLRSLVQSTTMKMTVENLNRDYYEMLGEHIPFKAFGFSNLEQFLRSLNDTLLIVGTGSTATVYFVGSEKSQHIHGFVMNQKSMRSKGKRRRNSPVKKTNSQRKHFNNKATSESKPNYTLAGSQLSNYENVNRKYMIRTPCVRDAPTQNVPINPPLLQNVIIQSEHNGIPKLSPYITNNTSIINQNTAPALCNNKNNDISRNELFKPNNNNIYSKPKQIYNNFEKEKSTMSTEHQININHQNIKQSNEVRVKIENVSSEVLDLPDKIKALLISESVPKINLNNVIKMNGNVALDDFKSECNNTSENTHIAVQATENIPYDNFHMKNLTDALDEAIPKFAVPHEAKPYLPNDKEEELKRKEYPGGLNGMYSHTQTNGYCQNTLNPTKRQQLREWFLKSATKNSSPRDINENQLEDAIPQFAANDIVFRLDVPKIAVPFGKKIPPYTLSTDIKVGTRLKIFISEIHSAYRFWFHIQKDDHELDELMYQLELYYTGLNADELRIPDVCITKGQVCAAAYNGLWHRGEILNQAVNGKVKVLFLDYGTVSDVSINDIKYLKSCYATLPCQALRGCLSYIQPNGPHWSTDSTVYFLSLVNNLMLFAEISEIDEEECVYYMVICETHNGIVQINKALIEKNYALFDSNWKDFKIKQNDGQRKRHPREDFPKFSILEYGEYPNLTQLVHLQQHGIEFETIYDTALFNPVALLNKHPNAPESIRNLDFYLLHTNPFHMDIWLELVGKVPCLPID